MKRSLLLVFIAFFLYGDVASAATFAATFAIFRTQARPRVGWHQQRNAAGARRRTDATAHLSFRSQSPRAEKRDGQMEVRHVLSLAKHRSRRGHPRQTEQTKLPPF